MDKKKQVSIALVQATPVLGDKRANLDKIERYAMKEKADLLVFPELFLTGYQCKDELPRLAIREGCPEIKRLESVAQNSGSHIIVGAPFIGKNGQLYNSSLVIGPEGYIGRTSKWYFPNFLPFDEKRYFHRGDQLPVFETPVGNIGLLICFDIFFPELSMALTLKGAEILVCISAAPSLSRFVFETVIPTRAIENTVFFLYCNLTGTDERLTFWGGSTIITPKGNEIAKGDYFKEQVVRATIDHRELPVARSGRPVLREKRTDIFEHLKELI